MARYHINAKGEPGKCKAFTNNCPYGSESDHFDSPEDAYKRIASENEGSFSESTELKKLSRSERINIALNSSDEKELMRITIGLMNSPFGFKIARALSNNPNTPASVLIEARSKAQLATPSFVALETHPNYPINNFTNEGAYMYIKTHNKNELEDTLKGNEVGDVLTSQINLSEHSHLALYALENPNNKLTPEFIRAVAKEKREYSVALAKSGRWPSKEEINRTDSRRLTHEEIAVTAEHSTNQEVLENIYEKYENGSSKFEVSFLLLKNKNSSKELKSKVKKNLKGDIDFLNSVKD